MRALFPLLRGPTDMLPIGIGHQREGIVAMESHEDPILRNKETL